MRIISVSCFYIYIMFLYLYICIYITIKQKQKKKKKYIKIMKSEKHFIYIKNKISIYFINIGKY